MAAVRDLRAAVRGVMVLRSLTVAPGPAVGAQADFVLVSGTHRDRARPELSVRKLAPLLARTSTVDADELRRAVDDDDDEGADREVAKRP